VSGPYKEREATLRACSACTGDYEDPERTAWVDESSESEEGRKANDSQRDERGEFPVEWE
jgi:hypothetical protein